MFIKLNNTLLLQVIWLCLAASYNLLNLYFISINEQPLIEGKHLQMLMMLSFYLIVILLGYWRKLYLYMILSMLLLIGLFIKGVVPHLYLGLIENDLSRYSSLYAWLIAIAINIFGLVAFALGIFQAKARLYSFSETQDLK